MRNSGLQFLQKTTEPVGVYLSPHASPVSLPLPNHALEWEIKPETKIEDCENCGEEGYGKAWFGRGRETGDAWGDRYTPTGSVVFCKNCKPEFRIGKDWNGEEIWKTTSDDPQHDTLRINCITKTVNKEWNQALTSIITRYKEELKVLESK